MRILVLAVGRLRAPFSDDVAHYEKLLSRYARVEIVESMGGMDEAVNAARGAASSGEAFLPDQFSNPANPEAHRTGTGPEILRALDGRVDVFVNVKGSGKHSQSGAVLLGLARALKEFRSDLEPALRDSGFLTRDARKVERKKYGHRKARKSFQFSKR